MDTPTDRATGASVAIDMAPEDFRALGHEMVDRIANFLGEIPERPAGQSQLK